MPDVRVAIIDSGVHPSHPHVGGVVGGIGIDDDGHAHDDYVDRLGHGTAVAAVIREKAPAAEIYAIKVFDRELSATGCALVAACDRAIEHGARIVNLSLGTQNAHHERALSQMVERARQRGVVIVAAGPHNDVRWLPGSLTGAWAVTLDWDVPRDGCRLDRLTASGARFRASGFPRPIPGVPPERNLKGLSFAVANVTGIVAHLTTIDPTGDSTLAVTRAFEHGLL